MRRVTKQVLVSKLISRYSEQARSQSDPSAPMVLSAGYFKNSALVQGRRSQTSRDVAAVNSFGFLRFALPEAALQGLRIALVSSTRLACGAFDASPTIATPIWGNERGS